MKPTGFLDTNILIYAHDDTDLAKHQLARQLVWRGMDGEFAVSTQVLTEFAQFFLHKARPTASRDRVHQMLEALSPIPFVAPGSQTLRRAVDGHARYQLHFYDALIVAAAELAGCSQILSEDLNHGQKYFGIEVVNPFL